jgi:predicted unusual protein kinase regulating ubiquinone biosynthesis (AarF/ABC1/UbiB family)
MPPTSTFRGPYADGPPPEALVVDEPSLTAFHLPELRRMATVATVLGFFVLRALAAGGLRRIRLRHGATAWATVGADGLVDALIHLGPTYVKLGQLVASSPGLFPAILTNAARRCLDAVPPFPIEDVRRMVAEDLGHPPQQIFREFDDHPLSAASIGQVHGCVLPDGREAVVKVQRPAIRDRMTTDLRIAYRLAQLFERTRWGRSANATGIIIDLHALTFQELNPALEAFRQDRFRTGIWAFGDNAHVTAPEIYWEYCGPRMICMERVSGIPMDDFDGIAQRQVDGELVLRRGAKVWTEAVLCHGLFHGDMHAGNIWVLDDGRGCYLDFGIMGTLEPAWQQVMRDLYFTTMFDRDFTRIARSFRSMGVFPPDIGTDEEIGMRLGMILGPMLAGGMAAVSLGDLITTSVELMKSYGGTAPRELILIGKQLLYIERYVKVLAPDYSVIQDAFLVKNVFPEEAKAYAEAHGDTFPD